MYFFHIILIFLVFLKTVSSQCQPGWYGDGSTPVICYFLVTDYSDGTGSLAAKTYCQGLGAQRPAFQNDDEYARFVTVLKNDLKTDCWIDLICNDNSFTKSCYQWTTLPSQTLDHWKNGEPKNHHCVRTEGGNKVWKTEDCESNGVKFVCQKRLTGNCPNGFHADASGGICYSFVDTVMTAQDAQKTCNLQSTISNLPTFRSQAELNNYIALSQTLNKGIDWRWVGLTRLCNRLSSKTAFHWIDSDSAPIFDYWVGGQPDNNQASFNNEEQTCVRIIQSDNYTWHDHSCNDPSMVVCQYRIDAPSTPISFNAPICYFKPEPCPLGWSQSPISPQLCFFFVTLQTQKYFEAISICKSIDKRSTLPILKSENDKDALKNLTAMCSNDVLQYTWMGFTYNNTLPHSSIWMDDSQMSYNHFCGNEIEPTSNYPCCTCWGVVFDMCWACRTCIYSINHLITCQLNLNYIPTNINTTCSFVPQPGYQIGNCPNYMRTQDNRIWSYNSVSKNWVDAFNDCNSRGARLVWPQHQADIHALIELTGQNAFWIGASSERSSSHYAQWYTTANNCTNQNIFFWPNQPSTYATPQYSTNGYYCLYYSPSNNVYTSGSCTSYTSKYVCEKVPAEDCQTYYVENSNTTTTCEGKEVYVTCNAGYYLIGVNPRVCASGQQDQYWMTEQQQCIPFCFALSPIDNGTVVYTPSSGQYDINSIANITCKNGYYPVPSNAVTVKCLTTGQWETPAQCSDKCKNLDDPENGHVQVDDSTYKQGTKATFTCNDNFNLIGTSSTLTCKANYDWDLPIPTCQPCGMPENGIIYRLVNNNFNCAMEIAFGNHDQGAAIITFLYYDPSSPFQGPNQEWFVKKINGLENKYILMNMNSRLVLDATSNNLKQQEPTCSSTQQVEFQSAPNCSVYIHVGSGTPDMVLSNIGTTATCMDATTVSVQQKSNTLDQQWNFIAFNNTSPIPTEPICSEFTTPSPPFIVSCNPLCKNGGTCFASTFGYQCLCPTGYFGNDCGQTNFCIIGSFAKVVKRRKRQISLGLPGYDAINNILKSSQLVKVLATVDNTVITAENFATVLINNTVNTANEVVDGALSGLEKTLQHFNLQTSLPGADPCAPNGICISGLNTGACICNPNYYGSHCESNNCTTYKWADWLPWSDCYVEDCVKGTGIRNRTQNAYSTCVPPVQEESCIPECIPPDPLTPTARVVATVAQSIGCTVLIILIIVTLSLFTVFRIISLERMLQMGQELALLIGHVTIMVIMKWHLTNRSCSIVGIILQFAFLTNFTFLALEALQTFCILQNVLSDGGFFSWRFNLLIGITVPFTITVSTAMTMFRSYRSAYSCWLNFGGKILYATLLPTMALFCISIILTEAAAMGNTKKLPLTSKDKYTAALVSQKGSVLIMVFNLLSFTFGAWALYAQKVELYGLVLTFNIILGVVIFMFHTLSNEQVHRFLKSCIKKKQIL